MSFNVSYDDHSYPRNEAGSSAKKSPFKPCGIWGIRAQFQLADYRKDLALLGPSPALAAG